MRLNRPNLVGIVAAVLVLGVSSAEAKDFQPGELSICNAKRCVPIMALDVVAELGPFYYSGSRLTRVAAPRMRAPAFELRFDNGYATGIVAPQRLDRFLSYGVHIGRFAPGVWYRMPSVLSAELRRLTAGLRPLRVTPAALRRSR